jgi:membrane protein implicated in regulation of membrane protease activity
MHFSFFPMSPLLWSAGLGVTGAVGEVLRITVGWPTLLIFALAVPCGYVVMFALLNFVFIPLKRVNNNAKTEEDLAYATAKVMDAIPAGGYGSVRIEGSVGTAMYAAYEVDGAAVPQGTTVWVIRIVNGRAEVQHDSSGKLTEIMN